MIIKSLKKTIALCLVFCVAILAKPTNSNGFTVGEEKELGEKLLYAVRASFPILGDPDLHQYINSLGAEVLQVAGFQFFDYRFYIVESNQFNAFAAPSGLIFFYTKLIESMNSEDELVSVLAHEIGHVAKRHLASRMEKGRIINLASLGLALASIAFGGAATPTLLAGSMAAGQSAQLHFSRQDEIEADLLAYQWIKDLERDPHGQEEMLKTMRRITRYRMGQMPQYLLTHPDPEARLNYVESLIAADSNDTEIREHSDFAFLRFKYRIMSIAQDNTSSRAYLANIIADARASKFSTMMAKYGLSQLDRQEKNYERSLSQLDEVIAFFPDRRILKVDRGVVLTEMGLYNEAQSILETAVREDPFDMYATFNLAKVLYKTDEKDRALQLFRDVSYTMPEYPAAYFEIGRVLAESGKPIESRFYLGKYNLYEGKLKLAASNFKQVSKSADAGEKLQEESLELLDLIERLQED